ncbi:hypothetical protein BU16DRAFT_520933 [Lophium mytilinum]|uniref:Endonuclease/exonuclease/phosphatase domain-containing protein n=1 Tax=Lophium mytilinum TaxID=390894 RepID=A0A6A6RCC1_9PEZI|nr:hypothetical protein BU16DRAFT_520933 [Lophium mytilinum]
MEQITKLAEKYAKWPACTDKVLYRFTNEDGEDDPEETPQEPAPSMEYSSGSQVPLIMCGDFNSPPPRPEMDYKSTYHEDSEADDR